MGLSLLDDLGAALRKASCMVSLGFMVPGCCISTLRVRRFDSTRV